MAEELLGCCYRVHGRDYDKGGETSTEIKSLLTSLDLDPHDSCAAPWSWPSRPR